jgi:NitT/TauT family transport system permease protein
VIARAAHVESAAPQATAPGAAARQRTRTVLVSVGLFALLLVVWEGVVRALHVPDILVPPPSDVAVALWDGFATDPAGGAAFYQPTLQTLLEALSGLALGSVIGLALAILLSQLAVVERYAMPYIMAFQSLPKIAIAPLLIVWFGFGPTSTIVLTITSTFFAVLINALEGFKATDNDRIDLLRVLGGSRSQIFRMVTLPSALPFIFSGLQIGLVISILTTIVGEFINGRGGLGARILLANNVLDIPDVFAVLIVLGVMVALLDFLLRLLRRRFLFWSPSQRRIAI